MYTRDPIKEKERSLKRREYFRDYQRRRRALGLTKPYKSHRMSMAYKSEVYAQSLLQGSKRIYRPCDLEWKGKLIDVKVSTKSHILGHSLKDNIHYQSNTYRWKFFLKQLRKVDFFFIICNGLKGETEYIFLIPDKELKHENLSISEKNISKYSKYLLKLQ